MIPKKIILVTFFIIGLASALVFVFSAKRELSFSETMAFAQFVFTILAFSAVLYTLYYASAQFRKTMAKPLFSLSFSEDGKNETTLDAHNNTDSVQTLDLWLANNGNAVTNAIQVELDIPEEFNPNFRHISKETRRVPHRPSPQKGIRIVSFYSIDKYYFVGIPSRLISIEFETHSELYDDYPKAFKIPYKLFGDWAEAQTGELLVKVHKIKSP